MYGPVKRCRSGFDGHCRLEVTVLETGKAKGVGRVREATMVIGMAMTIRLKLRSQRQGCRRGEGWVGTNRVHQFPGWTGDCSPEAWNWACVTAIGSELGCRSRRLGQAIPTAEPPERRRIPGCHVDNSQNLHPHRCLLPRVGCRAGPVPVWICMPRVWCV